MWNLEIKNIGGIRSGHASLNRGPNIVQASNFQGKSSLLAAIQTVMGTTGQFDEEHPLMEGADEGRVTLETEDGSFTTTLTATPGHRGRVVTRNGDTYLTDEQDQVAARLFAFLGEDNPVRAAVREGDTERLSELLRQPLETEDIDTRIQTLQAEVDDIKSDKKEAEAAAKKLPSAQQEVTQLEEDLKELRERRDELEQKVDETDEQEDLREKIEDKQSTLSDKRGRVEKLENNISRRESKLNTKEEELEDLTIPEEEEFDADIDEKQERQQQLELKISLLEDLHRANKTVLDEDELSLITEVNREITGTSFSCFICGGEATKEEFKEQLKAIKQKQQELEAEKQTIDSQISDIKQRQSDIDSKRRKKDRLEREIKTIRDKIRENRNQVENLEEDIEELQEELDQLEAEYEEAEEEEEEYGSELNNVQRKIGQKEQELNTAEGRLETLEEDASDRQKLQEDLDEARSELKELRKRRDKKYRELTDRFEEAMDEVVSTFAPGFEGGYLAKKGANDNSPTFEVNLARDGGSATDIENLSGGERELVGILTAIAGYKTFNVAERVPCILLDGIGQLSAENTRRLITYLEDDTEILVTTAYPEAGSFSGEMISPDDWEVVSDGETATP